MPSLEQLTESPWPGSQGPSGTLSDHRNSLPLSVSHFSPSETHLGAMAFTLPCTPTCTEFKPQQPVGLSSGHEATATGSGGRGADLPERTRSAGQSTASCAAPQSVTQSFCSHTWNNKSHHRHSEITLQFTIFFPSTHDGLGQRDLPETYTTEQPQQT